MTSYSVIASFTIVPLARMGSESIAHETEGRMGYWNRAHSRERNNCFSKIQLVGKKYWDETSIASKTRFSRHWFFPFPIQLYWTWHVQLTFTKDNLQLNENYNLKLTKKKPNTIKTLVVTKIKWERNQLSKQNFIPYLKETKKQTILFWNLFRDESYMKYIFLD